MNRPLTKAFFSYSFRQLFFLFPVPRSSFPDFLKKSNKDRLAVSFSCAAAVACTMLTSPAWAGDPFRSQDTRPIGDRTEAAFEAIFKQGNYPQAQQKLTEAVTSETSEPMAWAMQASLAYTEGDWQTLQTSATRTIETAENLVSIDPLRGNLYLAVGHFLEGTYNFVQEDDIVGAIAKLQLVFQHLDEAEKADPNDPELNLVKGYMELMLAVNLPFSEPEKAIERLESASPSYLVNRGIALAYRDLKEYSKAQNYVELAIQATPNNPELHHLKGQIIKRKGQKEDNLALVQESLPYFDTALEKVAQLPKATVKALRRERRKAMEWIESRL